MARIRLSITSANSFHPPSKSFLLRCIRCHFECSHKIRAFTTSASKCSAKEEIALRRAQIPLYPYGHAQWYKQSDQGLYGGLKIASGNHVAESEARARRKWRPNIQRNPLYSEALDRTLEIKVSTRVLRTIDKVGGLDEYLLGQKSQRIKDLGMMGWKLRWELMQTPAIKARFAKERKLLGLAEMEPEATTELRKQFAAAKKRPPRQEVWKRKDAVSGNGLASQTDRLKHQFRKDDVWRPPKLVTKKMKTRGDILGMSSPLSSRANGYRGSTIERWS